jgi:hypothetical protein
MTSAEELATPLTEWGDMTPLRCERCGAEGRVAVDR